MREVLAKFSGDFKAGVFMAILSMAIAMIILPIVYPLFITAILEGFIGGNEKTATGINPGGAVILAALQFFVWVYALISVFLTNFPRLIEIKGNENIFLKFSWLAAIILGDALAALFYLIWKRVLIWKRNKLPLVEGEYKESESLTRAGHRLKFLLLSVFGFILASLLFIKNIEEIYNENLFLY